MVKIASREKLANSDGSIFGRKYEEVKWFIDEMNGKVEEVKKEK